jgi:phospholipase/carboxylesterase
VKLTRFADLTARVAGGTDREGAGSGPVVVLLHGFGAPGDDLVSLWRTVRAPAGTRFVFPEAPLELGETHGSGRAWWWIDIEARVRDRALGLRPDIDAIPDGLEAARAKVDALFGDVVDTLRPAPAQVVLGGFSQGAMLSLDVALHSDRPLAGLILMSGTHIAAARWAKRYDRRKGLRIFMSHGEDDELLPFDEAERLRDVLVSHGLPIDWLPFRGGHGIPWEVMNGVGGFLRGILA